MHLRHVHEQIQVTADAIMVKIELTAASQVIHQAGIEDLPLNGLQPTQVIMHSGSANGYWPGKRRSDLVTSKIYFSAIRSPWQEGTRLELTIYSMAAKT